MGPMHIQLLFYELTIKILILISKIIYKINSNMKHSCTNLSEVMKILCTKLYRILLIVFLTYLNMCYSILQTFD